jgi:hypothetical protein
MYSVCDTHCWVGCPIRISTDQRLLAAPRGFSQRATSFIASWCQGIHRMPFLYSISSMQGIRDKPRRLASTMHRNHPQFHGCGDRFTAVMICRTALEIFVFSAHNTIFSEPTAWPRLRGAAWPFLIKSFTTPLNPRRRPLGRCSCEQPSRSDIRPNDGTLALSADRPRVARAQRRTRT